MKAGRGFWARMAALCLVGGCSGQKHDLPPVAIVGGWQAVDPQDEDVQAAARYAAGLVPAGHGALAEVASAQTQVVSGTNIRMVLHFADGSQWQATVWQRLDGSFALTEAEPLPSARMK